MKLFLDTSSLFKLYLREADTAELESKLSTIAITSIYLSEITKIEFTSTVWKKVNNGNHRIRSQDHFRFI